MSAITTIILMVSNIDGEIGDSGSRTIGPNVQLLIQSMADLGFNGALRDVTDHTGGGNVPSPIFIGAFKQGDHEGLIARFLETSWLLPDLALLILQTEDGPFQIFTQRERSVVIPGEQYA